MYQLPKHFVAFKLLNCRFKETIGFDVKASFARPPVSRLIKPDDETKKFKKNLFSSIELLMIEKHKLQMSILIFFLGV